MRVQHSVAAFNLRGCRNISSDKKKKGPADARDRTWAPFGTNLAG